MADVAAEGRKLIAVAQRLADEVLFPSALEVDRAGVVPKVQLDALAEAGLYGLSVSAEPSTMLEVIEALASGCLTSAFVWAQHQGASAAASKATGPVHAFADDLAAGQLRGGVAFAHMLRPDPPLTTAEAVDGGWIFRGSAPWVTGWGHIDLVHAASRNGPDIVWALIDAQDSATLEGQRLELAAVDSTQTVVLHFRDHFVPDERVTDIVDHDTWRTDYRKGLRNNGSFPLGIARRCCQLLDNASFDARLVEIRSALDEAPLDEVEDARAEAALFAVRAATALVAASGGRSVTMNDHAQRLYREAMFLLVQGQTPTIRQAMLDRLAG